MQATVKELTADTIVEAMTAAKKTTEESVTGYDVIVPKSAIELDDYTENVTYIGRLVGSEKPIIIQISTLSTRTTSRFSPRTTTRRAFRSFSRATMTRTISKRRPIKSTGPRRRKPCVNSLHRTFSPHYASFLRLKKSRALKRLSRPRQERGKRNKSRRRRQDGQGTQRRFYCPCRRERSFQDHRNRNRGPRRGPRLRVSRGAF